MSDSGLDKELIEATYSGEYDSFSKAVQKAHVLYCKFSTAYEKERAKAAKGLAKTVAKIKAEAKKRGYLYGLKKSKRELALKSVALESELQKSIESFKKACLKSVTDSLKDSYQKSLIKNPEVIADALKSTLSKLHTVHLIRIRINYSTNDIGRFISWMSKQLGVEESIICFDPMIECGSACIDTPSGKIVVDVADIAECAAKELIFSLEEVIS